MKYLNDRQENAISTNIDTASDLKLYYEAQYAKVLGRNAETKWFRAFVKIVGIATGLFSTAAASIGLVLFFGLWDKLRDAQIAEDEARRAALQAQASAHSAVSEAQKARDEKRQVLFEIESERESLRNLRRQISASSRMIEEKNDQIVKLEEEVDRFKKRAPKTAAYGISFFLPEHKYGYALATAMTDRRIQDFSPPAAPQTRVLLFADGSLAYRIKTRRFVENETIFRTEFASGWWTFENGRYRLILRSQDSFGGEDILELYVSERQLLSYSSDFEVADKNPSMCFLAVALSEKSKLFPTDKSICVQKNI